MAEPPLLTLTDITLGWGGAPLFKDLSLVIQPGDRICLVGRNGSGKSTLMKVMAGDVEPDSGERFVRPGASVGRLPQDPDLSGFETLGDYAAAGLPPEERWRAESAMDALGVRQDAHPDSASGGERRRAALARIVAEGPDVMLLDEPTNHLDIDAIAWAEEHLAQTRAAFVLISHDRAFLRRLTRQTLWLDRGEARRVERGFDGFEEWRDKHWEEEDAQRHKLDRLIKAEARWAVEGISARRKRNMGRVRRLQEMKSERAGQIRRQGAAAMELSAGPKSGKLVVEAKGISKAFGDRVIVKDFSIRVMRGDRVAFVGPNGAGKTTLLRMLTGDVAPDAGEIRLGTNLVPAVFDQARAQFDEEASLWESLTHDPQLGVSGNSDQVMVRGTPRHVVGYLKDFLFDERQARGPVKALSGGERARLQLAKIMARESNLLILDEPTNDLDVETLDLLQELVADFDGTVLLVSHDRDFLDRTAATTIAMEPGGRATVYAGGWTDHLAQKKLAGGDVGASGAAQAKKPKGAKKPGAKPEPAPAPAPEAAPRFTGSQARRLEELPAVMERLEAEIAKLEEFLSQPDLYDTAPVKFAKATEGLTERQAALAAAEEEWLELEAAKDAAG
ncbi:ABC-F family ATP-binding cassette domain-containing protein [Rhodovulum sp. DZ06]|uniref:ABC-F family ATP-binding cassette domain-containing protein n=1 Tax=Rhodovulum sp. DZ06 TaxID=3425126 RepID=UPI003D34D8E9